MTLNRAFVERMMADPDYVDDAALVMFEMEEEAIQGYKPGMGRDDEDMSPFREANTIAGRPRTKAAHTARAEMVKRQYPSTTAGTAAVKRIFDERPEVFRAILKVLVEVDAAQDLRPGQAGRRPSIGYADGSRRLLRLFGKEYSSLPFPEAFSVLCGARSVRAVAAKTGLSRSQVLRLRRGEIEPSGQDMEAVAKGFALHPSFFIEWRTAAVIAAIHHRMNTSPETSMNLYAKLVNG